MSRGKFIVIEGGDGAGKDTQIELLKEALKDKDIIYTRDPGGTPLGNKLRETLQYGENVAQETELLLFLASRAQLVAEVIRPAVETGTHVISNRFDPSTLAYQIYGRGRRHLTNLVKAVSGYANIDVRPDLVIFLDVTPSVGLSRTKARHESGKEKESRFEKEEMEFHERVRGGYRAAMQEYPEVCVVNADQEIETVHSEVLAAVRKLLG
jgi:dTMP kinase